MLIVADPIIADRYGRTRRDPGRTRRLLLSALAAFLAAVVGLAAWSALSRPDRVVWTDLGITVTADDAATVTFQVALPPDRQAVCTVRVVNEVHADVGRRDVVVGPAPQGVLRTEVRLRTSERATAGGVRACTVR